jgi:hypothetical protein
MNRFPLTSTALTAIGALLLLSNGVRADEIDPQKCPAPVQKALQEAGKINKVDKQTTKDGVVYDADGTSDTGRFEIVVGADGKVLRKSEESKMATCPAPVKLAIVGKTNGKTINSIEKITEDGNTTYVVESHDKGNHISQVEIGSDGKLVMQDDALTPESTPPAIKKAIAAKVTVGGRVTEVHKLTDAEGKVTYTARIVSTVMNLELDGDGKVLSYGKAEE